MAFDSAGSLYLAGFGTKSVLMVTPSGTMTLPFGTQSLYPRGNAGLVTAPDGSVLAMDGLSVVRLTKAGPKTVIAFGTPPEYLFHGIRGFLPNGIAVGDDGTIYVDTFSGNGYADKTAIASIDPSGTESAILWRQP